MAAPPLNARPSGRRCDCRPARRHDLVHDLLHDLRLQAPPAEHAGAGHAKGHALAGARACLGVVMMACGDTSPAEAPAMSASICPARRTISCGEGRGEQQSGAARQMRRHPGPPACVKPLQSLSGAHACLFCPGSTAAARVLIAMQQASWPFPRLRPHQAPPTLRLAAQRPGISTLPPSYRSRPTQPHTPIHPTRPTQRTCVFSRSCASAWRWLSAVRWISRSSIALSSHTWRAERAAGGVCNHAASACTSARAAGPAGRAALLQRTRAAGWAAALPHLLVDVDGRLGLQKAGRAAGSRG